MSLFRMILRSKKPTHVITVGQYASSSYVYYGLRSGNGAISPDAVSVDGYTGSIRSLCMCHNLSGAIEDYTRIEIDFGKPRPTGQFRFRAKRMDTGVAIECINTVSQVGYKFTGTVYGVTLFTAEDVGKSIPLEITMEARQ